MRLTIFLLAILFYGCATQKRCLTKYPPVTSIERHDTTIYRDTIIYHDRTVYDTIQADTVFAKRILPINIPGTFEPIVLENDYARAMAWVEGRLLKLELTQKEQVIKRILRNAEKQEKYWREKYESVKITEVHTEYKVRTVHKIGLYFTIVTLLFGIFYIVLRIMK